MSDDPIELLKRLVAIDSVNPDLVPGGAGEKAIGDFCGAWLGERGFEVHRLEEHPGRPSIVGVAKGSGGGRSLMFNGHYDTVTLAGYDGDPLDPERRCRRQALRARLVRHEGGVAAMMVAAARAKARNLRGDILVACVADEEYASFGTEEVARHFRADAAIVTEPSHLELTVAHKGFAWFEVIVEGRAAHGSRPDLGIDAIAKAGKFLVALEAYDRRLRADPTHAILKSGSVHASMIDGGAEWSSYPARCRISLERRTIPGETPRSCRPSSRRSSMRSPRRIRDFQAIVELGLNRGPFEVPETEPIVATLDRVAAKALGRKPTRRGEPFWTDCAILKEAGIPCVMFGADGAGAHAATEWTTVELVRTLADILADTAIEFCS